MSEDNKSIFRENLEILSNPDNFQKYVLGTKKNGAPRAIFDVVKCYTKPKKKKHKKEKKCGKDTTYSFYLNAKSGKHKKKKKKKNQDKYWHI